MRQFWSTARVSRGLATTERQAMRNLFEMIFEFHQTGVEAKTGKVIGSFMPTGMLPSFQAEIEGKAMQLPREMLVEAQRRSSV